MKTKHILLILSVFLISCVISCSNGSNMSYDFDSEKAQNEEYINSVIKSIKRTTENNKHTICLSSVVINVQSSNRNAAPSYAAEVEKTISYLEKDGQHPFIFTNGNGDKFILAASDRSSLSKITENYVLFIFDTIYKIINIDEEKNTYDVSSPLRVWNETASGLLDTKTGSLYDVSDFAMHEAIADDTNIYVRDFKNSVYKIDIKTLKATQISNGSIIPLSNGDLSIINKDLLLFKGSNGDPSYIVFINKNIAPKKIDFEHVDNLKNYYIKTIPYDEKTPKFHPLIMKGKDGQLYFYATASNNILTGKISFDTTSSSKVKIIISDTKETSIPQSRATIHHADGTTHSIYSNECTNCSELYILNEPHYLCPEYPLRYNDVIFNYDKLVLASNYEPLIRLSIENNELKVTFRNDVNDFRNSPAIYQNDVFYYIHMNEQNIPTLYKYDVKTNNTEPTVLYSHKDLINKLSIKKDGLVLHKYLNRTEVGIFLFDLATKQIKQIGNNNTEINSIVEMNF